MFPLFEFPRSFLCSFHHICFSVLKPKGDLTVTKRCGVVVITTALLHSTKPELRFYAGSNPARGGLEIRDGEDL